MKPGDLVKLDIVCYPLQHKLGVLIKVPRPRHSPRKWVVMIAGKLHPYTIEEAHMEAFDEVQG
jgi:hypothetical protein